MIEVDIPGGEDLRISHLVLDYNGTLARDGELLEGVAEKMKDLAIHLQLHVITADTHGTVAKKLAGLPCSLEIIGLAEQDKQKEAYVRHLGANKVAAIGNGRNDGLMLKEAALGFVLVQEEGACVASILQADIMCTDILAAFDIFLNPARLKATLRN
jgi:soluble P-type ATPase